ncbi:MAG: hypothetical protein JXB03_03345 [Spirochaetales bacterium]|nr:hypothetical protein [Spirochaetales bacterium]
MKGQQEDAAEYIYRDDEAAYRNLRFYLEFLKREFPKGLPRLHSPGFQKSLRKLDGHIGAGEFFSGSSCEKKELIALFLAGDALPEVMELEKTHDILKDLFSGFFSSYRQFPFTEYFLPHLVIKKTRLFKDRKNIFLSAFRDLMPILSQEEWTRPESLCELAENEGLDLSLFPEKYAADYIYFTRMASYHNILGDSGTYEEHVYLDTAQRTIQHAVIPAIRGLAALLASFGLADLLIKPGTQKDPGKKEPEGLGPFLHIRAFKLSPLGRYVFGLDQSFSQKTSDRFLHLSPALLIASTQDTGGLAFLLKIGEQVSEHAVRTDINELFSRVETREELDYARRYIRQHCLLPVPENWERFLSLMETRSQPLLPVQDVLCFQIPDNRDLLRFLGQSKEASSLYRRAEKRTILIAKQDYRRFINLLRKNGFFLD